MNRLFEYMSAKKNTYRNVGIFNDPETAGYLADTSGITAAGIDPENKQADLGMYQMLIAGCGAISGMSSEMKNKITGFVQNGGIFLGLVYKPDVRLDWIAEGIQAEKPKVSRILSINHDKQKITDGMKIIWASSDRPEDSKWQVTSKTPRQPINLTATLKADDSWTPLIIPHSSFREPEYTNYNQLCYQKSGKGYYVISALPLDTHAYIISRTFNTLLGNLGAADNTSSIMSEILKQSGRDPGMQISMKETGDQDWNNYFPVNLRAHVNMELQDDVPGDQKGGWDDSGPNDLRMLPTGKMTFSGIPYDIISKKEELYVGLTKQIIVMRGAQKQYFPQSVNSIPVDKKCSGLHFLHVLTWAGKIPDGTGHGKYVIRFTDGSTEEISIKQNINISDWWEVNNRVRIPEAEIAYMAKNQKSVFVGLYHFRYKLKNPEKIIKSIDIVTSGDKGIIIVAAITGEK
ncbi:MAG TPA: hypothetical protein DC049_11650 [Spirochaetia bacterium]|nr:hypothetical protein [Spirochaetia bacterium]